MKEICKKSGISLVKTVFFAGFVCAALVFAASCKGKGGEAGDADAGKKEAKKYDLGADASYVLGMFAGENFKNTKIDIGSYMRGLKDTMDGKEPRFTPEEANEIFQNAQEGFFNLMKAENAGEAAAFLAENGKKEGVITTESGLEYEVLEAGSGESPVPGDSVRVHYTGKLLDGSVFDSSVERGMPAVFNIENVIAGWTEGLQLMKAGGKYRLFIPPALGYGEYGTEGIPPDSLLIFDVELLEVIKPAKRGN